MSIANWKSKTLTRSAAASFFETLEGRQMMSVTSVKASLASKVFANLMPSNAYVINGTNGNDTITVNSGNLPRVGDKLTITINNVTKNVTIPISQPVVINGLAGNDVIRYSGGAGVTINGGDGNDYIAGGNGNDAINGNNGNDVLVSVGGGKATLRGGAGFDCFWADTNDTIADKEPNEALSTHVISHFDALHVNGQYVMTPPLQMNGQTLPDPAYPSVDAYGNALHTASFSNLPLFSASGPSKNDVVQGEVGDCYFLAALSALAKTQPTTIQENIVDLHDGTYIVDLHDTAGDHYIRENADLPVYASGYTAYDHVERPGALWVALMEKAFTFFRRGAGTYASIDSGFTKEGFNALNVGAAAESPTTVAQLYADLSTALSVNQPTTVSTKSTATDFVQSHVYVVDSMTTVNGVPSVVLRNPWGNDGPSADSQPYDGYITVPVTTLFNQFTGIEVGLI